MIDCISVEADVAHMPPKPSNEKFFLWNGIQMWCEYKRGEFRWYEGELNGLRLKLIYPKLYIQNSLHKFKKGDNAGSFSYSELCEAIDEISNITQIPANKLFLKKLEFGLNIDLEIKAQEVIKSLGIYGQKRDPLSFVSGVQVIGKKYVMTDYHLKFYDKVSQLGWKDQPPSILRVEITYKRKRPFTPIQTLEDLMDPSNLEKLFADLISKVNKVAYNGSFNLGELTKRERELLFAGMNPDFWNSERIFLKKSGLAAKRKKHLELARKATQHGDGIQTIVEKLEVKFGELMGS